MKAAVRRILIVEDDPKVGDILEHRLRQDGHDVRRASTGFEAGLLARSVRPQLVLLDLMLPGVDGAEVCRQIRSDPALASTKVLGMSASGDEAALERFRRLVDDFMPKPFKLSDIPGRIEKLLGPARPDPDEYERNRVVLFSPDPGWIEGAQRSLAAAGYEVEISATPEAAGFAAARLAAAAVAVHGVDAKILDSLRRSVRVVEGPAETLPASVARSAGKILRRRRSKGLLPSLVASVGILAVVAAILLWPRSAPPAAEPDFEVQQWRELERRAAEGRLVYYLGRYMDRATLGEAASVRLKDRTVEGFLAETQEGWILRSPRGTLSLRKEDILERHKLRLPYEDYWDRAASLPLHDAPAHHALGSWCRSQGLPEAAVREFRRALVADPGHAPSRHELGYSLRGGNWVR